ncbi:uncharacterized protein B0H18DRAFT_1119940 [Fomitopsis serialis]|uniref:uncharacterized protein n=1 Tax=Fomitopsis serialis TaxID=139415 RepID=UPI00200890E8|nr:uncharacterized protein B0H18DRAFT_1119940 [Neoantrodia serialis]KAH9924403.1 hypothetical protein B0H18DRAFT_1119940 [Neoantrodia serialis]
MPLLKILTSSVIALPTGPGSTQIVKALHLPIRDDEWLRLLSYARRIRRLYVRDIDFEHVDPTVWMTLAAQNAGSPLLSNLLHLQWSHLAILNVIHILPPSIQKLQATSTPPLEGLSIHSRPLVTRNEVVFQNIIYILASRATDVQDLSLRVSHASILEPIDRFRSLRRLYFDASRTGPLTRPLFDKLSRLQSLERLFIDLPNHTEVTSSPDGFPALREIRLAGNPAGIKHVLSAIRGAQLAVVTLIFKNLEESELPSICSILYNLRDCGSSSIHFLALKVIPRVLASSIVHESKGILKPLLTLRNVQRIDIQILSKLVVSAEDLQDIAVAWPNVITLHLFYIEDGQPLPPLSSLSLLAKHCPDLRSLELPGLQDCDVDFSNLRVSSHNLRRIFLGKQMVPSEKLARFLCALFPRLGTSVSHSHGPQWREMMTMIAALQKEAEVCEKNDGGYVGPVFCGVLSDAPKGTAPYARLQI